MIENGPLIKYKGDIERREKGSILKTSLNGNELSIKFYLKVESSSMINFPEELQNGLKDVD